VVARIRQGVIASEAPGAAMMRDQQGKRGRAKVVLRDREVERLEDLLKREGHDYEYAQAGCVLCKLHQRLVEIRVRRGPAKERKP